MNRDEYPPAPRLELVFADDGKQPFLRDAAFSHPSTRSAICTLVEQPPRGQYLRSLCIIILLAKYSGENADDPNQGIPFRDTSDRPSWLKSLGMSFEKGDQTDFFQTYFKGTEFISVHRGSVQNSKRPGGGNVLPSAWYYPKELRLKNLHLFKIGSTEQSTERTPIIHSELPIMAEKLEAYGMNKAKPWVPIVRELVKIIDERRPSGTQQPKIVLSASQLVAFPNIVSQLQGEPTERLDENNLRVGRSTARDRTPLENWIAESGGEDIVKKRLLAEFSPEFAKHPPEITQLGDYYRWNHEPSLWDVKSGDLYGTSYNEFLAFWSTPKLYRIHEATMCRYRKAGGRIHRTIVVSGEPMDVNERIVLLRTGHRQVRLELEPKVVHFAGKGTIARTMGVDCDMIGIASNQIAYFLRVAKPAPCFIRTRHPEFIERARKAYREFERGAQPFQRWLKRVNLADKFPEIKAEAEAEAEIIRKYADSWD